MHLRPQLSSIRSRFGYPYHPWWNQEFDERGFRLVEKSSSKDRFHDVTILIESTNGCYALMSKHSYPPGIYRSPSGGVHPGEDIAAGALREAHEETGLKIDLQRFLAHITLDILYEKDVITWDSYIFHATTKDVHLKPTDLKEVQDTLWATPFQMGRMIEKLRSTKNGGLIYRGDLTELSLWALENRLTFRPAGAMDMFFIEKSLVIHKQPPEDLERTAWWIAEINGYQIGTLGLASRKDCVEMTGLTVDLAYQGRGVGQALVEYVCDQWRNPLERKKLKGFQNWPTLEPLWLITPSPAYYLNIDFEMIDHEKAPASIRTKTHGLHAAETSMRTPIYRSQAR